MEKKEEKWVLLQFLEITPNEHDDNWYDNMPKLSVNYDASPTAPR